MMPRTQAAIVPEPFDPLQYLIDRAHVEGIELHAWVIATAIWNSITPPKTVTVAVSAGQVAAVELTPFMRVQENNQPIHPGDGFDPDDADLFLNGER